MALFTPNYSAPVTAISTAALQGLSINGARKAVLTDNTLVKAADVRVKLDVQVGATVAAGDTIDLYLAASHDGLSLTDGYAYNDLDTTAVAVPVFSQIIVSIPVTFSGQYVRWEDSILSYLASIPPYFAVVLHNRTASTLNGSHEHKVTYVFATYEYA